jgi:hypothetical protein
MDANTTGSSNIGIGKNALNFSTNSNYCVAIGYDADLQNASMTNAIAIGKNAKASISNTMILGGTGSDAISVGIGTSVPTANLDITAAGAESKIHLINSGTGSTGIEIRSHGNAAQYIDFANSSSNDFNSGTPDFTNRIISNSTTFSLPGITVTNSTGNVGIGGAASSSALLELISTTKAFVLPRMSKAQRNAISPIAGMMIYQTDNTPGLRVFNGSNWMRFTDAVDN